MGFLYFLRIIQGKAKPYSRPGNVFWSTHTFLMHEQAYQNIFFILILLEKLGKFEIIKPCHELLLLGSIQKGKGMSIKTGVYSEHGKLID